MKKIFLLTSILVISLFFLSGCSKVACENDEICGAEHYADNYCDESNVKKDLISYTCGNPGTKDAVCRENRQPEQVEECKYPYKCEAGGCMQQSCYELTDTVWLGGPTSSRIFFDTTKERNELIIMAMETGAEFKVHLYTDKDSLPERRLSTWAPLNDEHIDEYNWIRLSMDSVETMPSGYYWIGIEVTKYGDSAFNTCVTNDRNDDTFGRENNIIDGQFENFEDTMKTEHDIVYLFE